MNRAARLISMDGRPWRNRDRDEVGHRRRPRRWTWRSKGAPGRAGRGGGRGRTDPSVSRLGLVQTAVRQLRLTMVVPGTERERHERRGREPEGGGTEEKKRGRGNGVLVVMLLVIPSESSRGGAGGWRGLLIGGFEIERDPEVDGELVAAADTEWMGQIP